MIKETSICADCLCHLRICKAECCKSFNLIIPENNKIDFRRSELFAAITLTDDLKHYYKLHGCRVEKNGIVISMRRYKFEGNKLTVYMRCKALTPDLKCILHEKNEQPQICRSPNIRGDPIPGANVTPNCLYKELYDV